jgi:predicted dinucleotide-binding enzyme
MNIGIIGTGHIGKTLVRKLAKAGHTIQYGCTLYLPAAEGVAGVETR